MSFRQHIACFLWTVLPFGIFAGSALAEVIQDSPFVPEGYVMSFNDEFDGTSLDRSQWFTRYIFPGGTDPECSGVDWLNDEEEVYRDNGNHIVSNGALKLAAYYRPGSGWDCGRGQQHAWNYESGMIRSNFWQKYGYFEARVKMPSGLGVWPALWLVSQHARWPPEIDIFEFVNNGVEDRVDMLHTGIIDQGPQESSFIYSHPDFNRQWSFWRAPFNFPDDFHVIALLWDTDDTVTTLVDGTPIVTRGYRWVHNDGSDAGPAHILLNFAIGGQWAGRHGVDRDAFPQALDVDYVRVYTRSD